MAQNDRQSAGQNRWIAPRHKAHLHQAHHFNDPGTLHRQIYELRRMGASDDDLHAIVDTELKRLSIHCAETEHVDPGRGTPEDPIDPLDRARSLFSAHRDFEEQWIANIASKRLLVVAEFPPHILERLLSFGTSVFQVHPPTPEGDAPPHFRHLRGLRGVLDLKALLDVSVDILLFEGCVDESAIYVSPLVPVILRMFPNVEIGVLETDRRAPHMSLPITDSGFTRIPIID